VVEKQGKVQAFIRTIPLFPISVMKIQRASIKRFGLGVDKVYFEETQGDGELY
jgi:hypothetical protein